MGNELFFVMDKDRIDINLLRSADDSLPRVVRYLNNCLPFVALIGNEPVAVCLVEAREGYHDIVNLAVVAAHQGKGYGRAMLGYVMEYVKSNGGRYIDIGCGNANIRLYTMYQKAGFRVIGVWPDYYLSDNKIATVENSILNRDMIRLRADLHEKKLATTGYDASGRT